MHDRRIFSAVHPAAEVTQRTSLRVGPSTPEGYTHGADQPG